MNTNEIIEEIAKISKKPKEEVIEKLHRLSVRAKVPYEETVKIYYFLLTGKEVK